MKTSAIPVAAYLALSLFPQCFADDGHLEKSVALAEVQDELSADVQQLVIEQTHPKVIQLLGEVEDIMDEVVENLEEAETGGMTLAAQTEIIEKIHEAAKEKQKQSGGGQSGGAMMDMMERMMGKGEGEQKGSSKGKGEGGDQGGEGAGGLSDAANEGIARGVGENNEVRTVPKASGRAGTEIPGEFRKAFDAYNRGFESTLK